MLSNLISQDKHYYRIKNKHYKANRKRNEPSLILITMIFFMRSTGNNIETDADDDSV